MPEQVRCPECNTALRVPDNLLGKNVKCPKCQTTFVAEIEEPTAPEGIVREAAPPSRRSRGPDDIEEEGFLEEDDEERPRRRNRIFAEAKSLVSGPATALLVVGIIDIVLGIFLAIGVSLLVWAVPKEPGQDPQEVVVAVVFYVIFGIADIIMGAFITMGATRMKKLSSYGFALAACILAMIPVINCCLLGLPFGIWALVVLNKPEVKDAFR